MQHLVKFLLFVVQFPPVVIRPVFHVSFECKVVPLHFSQ